MILKLRVAGRGGSTEHGVRLCSLTRGPLTPVALTSCPLFTGTQTLLGPAPRPSTLGWGRAETHGKGPQS